MGSWFSQWTFINLSLIRASAPGLNIRPTTHFVPTLQNHSNIWKISKHVLKPQSRPITHDWENYFTNSYRNDFSFSCLFMLSKRSWRLCWGETWEAEVCREPAQNHQINTNYNNITSNIKEKMMPEKQTHANIKSTLRSPKTHPTIEPSTHTHIIIIDRSLRSPNASRNYNGRRAGSETQAHTCNTNMSARHYTNIYIYTYMCIHTRWRLNWWLLWHSGRSSQPAVQICATATTHQLDSYINSPATG